MHKCAKFEEFQELFSDVLRHLLSRPWLHLGNGFLYQDCQKFECTQKIVLIKNSCNGVTVTFWCTDCKLGQAEKFRKTCRSLMLLGQQCLIFSMRF